MCGTLNQLALHDLVMTTKMNDFHLTMVGRCFSRSTSSNTTHGFFPPSCQTNRENCQTARAASGQPYRGKPIPARLTKSFLHNKEKSSLFVRTPSLTCPPPRPPDLEGEFLGVEHGGCADPLPGDGGPGEGNKRHVTVRDERHAGLTAPPEHHVHHPSRETCNAQGVFDLAPP